MGRLPLTVVMLSFLGAILAGCTGDPAPAAPVEEAQGDANASGVIEGSVADAEIRPVAGARVGIVQLERTTTTDEAGTYRFGGVPSGTYVVQVEALGYETQARSITVGESAPAKVSFQLDLLPVLITGDPVIETREYAGLIGCSVATAVVTGTLCGEECTSDYHEALPEQCTKPDPNDETVLDFQIFNDTRTMILEYVWSASGGAAGDELLFRLHGCEVDENGEQDCPTWGRRSGKSPLRVEYQAEKRGERFNFTDPKDMRVWAFGNFNVTPGVFIQQRFTMYVTTALYFPAPLGTTGIPDQ